MEKEIKRERKKKVQNEKFLHVNVHDCMFLSRKKKKENFDPSKVIPTLSLMYNYNSIEKQVPLIVQCQEEDPVHGAIEWRA